MRRPSGFWNENDPVEYFKEHCSHVKSRIQLEKEDGGLYQKLLRTGKIDEVIPEKQFRDYKDKSAVEIFHEKYSHITSRNELKKEDRRLYEKLWKTGKIDEVIPERKKCRDYKEKSAVDVFKEKYSHVTSRGELAKEDKGLYQKLWKTSKLDDVLPEKQKRRDYEEKSAVELFYEKYPHMTSRGELSKEDRGLYCKLKKDGLLGEVLPEKREVRNYGEKSAVEIFKEEYSHVTSRWQLQKEDMGLYHKLRKTGKLDEVLPSNEQLRKEALQLAIVRYAG